jgi:anaerobic selenocysteine-containing dehydrogenase
MVTRRQFILGIGGGAVAFGTGAGASSLWKKPGISVLRTREETWANSICQLCPSGCGVKLRLCNGSPVTVTGNPFHPINRGGLCAKGSSSLQLYYDPDRFAGPLRRDGKVLGKWAKADWKGALSEVTAALQKAAAAGPNRVAVIRGGSNDLASQLFGRLAQSAGSEWVVDAERDTTGRGYLREVVERMHGVTGNVVYDLAGSDFLLSIDSGLLDASSDLMNVHRSFADQRSNGGRFVDVSPRLGVTGSKADEWVPSKPGAGGVFALGVAHMLIKEGLVDDEFLRDHVTGYEDWVDPNNRSHAGLRTWVLREFPPQRVAQLTGVGWDRLIRTARRFGSANRPLAVGPLGSNARLSLFDVGAIYTLNAIVGAIDKPGGVLLARKPPFPKLDEAPASPNRTPNRSIEDLADHVLESKQPPIDVCFIHNADPIFTSPRREDLAKALGKIPLVVSTSPVLTDTVEKATLVLPDSLWMERRSDSVGVDAEGHAVFSSSPAAVKPRADSRGTADVVIGLAKAVGGKTAAAFPWENYEALVKEFTVKLAESRAGG